MKTLKDHLDHAFEKWNEHVQKERTLEAFKVIGVNSSNVGNIRNFAILQFLIEESRNEK